MLKRDVREMVNYLVGERKSFKVTFANGKVEVVEYRGYCWVLGNKGYTDEELVGKMVRFQNNVTKFIIKLEVIEEEVKEEVASETESLAEEVENLTDDLFQEEDLAYCEEAIERESNVSRETNNKRRLRFMKKLLIATLTTISIITPSVSAGERMAKDDKVEIHKECFMHPVIVGKDKKLNKYTGQEYEINAYYDAVTGFRINTDYETIYMDDNDNRWYFPYDNSKFHYHEGDK